ncbi:MAG: pitrilysin family protein [Bryobacteraceae bacterium]
MRRKVPVAILLAALLSIAAFSQTPAHAPAFRKVTSVEGITEYAFPNGLHALLFPDPSKPKITVNMTYLVGSRYEGYGETGMAHLLEHLMFLQTKTRTNIKKELTDHGADMNGTTSFDRTNYFETLTASDENLRWALGLEADRMVNTRMEKSILDKEMTVVRNEFEMGENSPPRTLFQRTLETAYTWHNYGHLPIGSRSDIENVPIDRLAAFYHKYYQPDNAVLTIAGKFDEAKTLAWIAQLFGPIPRPLRKLAPTYTVEPVQDGERTVTLRRVGDVQEVMAAYHIPAAAHPDADALEVLAGVLGDEPAGRLYKALVESKKAVSESVDTLSLHDPGILMASATLRQEQNLDEARAILIQTLEGVAAAPPTKEEVEREKTRLLKDIDLEMTDTEGIALALSEALGDGDWRLLFLSRDRIKNVTEQDVARVASLYFKPSNRTVAEFQPDKSPDRAEMPKTPDLTALFKDFKGGAAISAGEVFDPTPANIEKRVVRAKLANGMNLVLLRKQTRGGTVVAQITMRFGDEKSLFGKSAAAGLTGPMLMRGTKNKTRQQIEDEMDKLKAQISINAGPNSVNAEVQTVEANFAGALRLVAEMLREPSFPQSEFDQMRQEYIASVEQTRTDPQSRAATDFRRRLTPYPRGDVRYVATAEEDIEDLKKLTLDDIRKLYAQFYGASNSQFVAAGQFDAAQIQKLAAELYGGWNSPLPFQRIVNLYQKNAAADLKIETPDKEMAFLVDGMRLKMSDEDPDYPALSLANYIFGGAFSSRLERRIRDKEGMSYGISSSVQVPAKDDGAMFVASARCAPQNAPKVEASFKDELARALKDGFTAAELADAKKAWLQERAVARSDDGSLVATLANREYFSRTMMFDQALETKVAALTPEQVSAAFRRIDPAELVTVKAGDFKKAGVYQ